MKNTVHIPAPDADTPEPSTADGNGAARPPISPETPVVPLLLGILDDLRQLLIQEVLLAKDEVLENFLAVKWTLLQMAVALALLAVGGLLLVSMGVHLLHAATGLPLWASYAVAGAAFIVGGGLWLADTRRRLRLVSFLPDKTLETIKETTVWLGKEIESIKT